MWLIGSNPRGVAVLAAFMAGCSASGGDPTPPDESTLGDGASDTGGGAAGNATGGVGGAASGGAGHDGSSATVRHDAGRADSSRSDSGLAEGGFDDGMLTSTMCGAPAHPSGVAVKVACVGDSITWGYAASDQATMSYPAQLGAMLGADYSVQNFGVNATDMLKNGDNPYWRQDAFTKAQASNPDIVVIGLGTNDIGVGSAAHLPEFEGDYESMVNVFKGLPSHPKVFAIYPAWFKSDNPGNGYTNARLDNERPMIQQAAAATGACIIDVNGVTRNHPEYYSGDGVHPNDTGYRAIANTVCGAVSGGCPPK